MDDLVRRLLINLSQDLPAFFDLAITLAVLIGFFMMIFSAIALIKTNNTGSQHQKGPVAAVVGAIIGVCLLNIRGFVDAVSVSVFAEPAVMDMTSYTSQMTSDDPLTTYIWFAVAVIMLIGVAGIIHGLIQWNRSVNNPQAFWPGTVEIIGGVIAVNFVTFAEMLAESAGGSSTDFMRLFF